MGMVRRGRGSAAWVSDPSGPTASVHPALRLRLQRAPRRQSWALCRGCSMVPEVVSSLLPPQGADLRLGLFSGSQPPHRPEDEQQLVFPSVKRALVSHCRRWLCEWGEPLPHRLETTWSGAQDLETKRNKQNYISQHTLLRGCRHVTQRPPIKCAPAGLWFKEQQRAEGT